MHLKKREFLALAGALGSALGWPTGAHAQASDGPAGALRLAASGAQTVDGQITGYGVGILVPDLLAGRMALQAWATLPSRAHGLAALPDGGFAVVANRPGRWLARLDAQARVQGLLDTRDAVRSFEGHVLASPDGQWLYTTETDPRTHQGWVSVRDARTLASVAQWRTGGSEPHQLLWDPAGMLVVANGGVLRAPGDRKVELHRMDSSLVRLHPQQGERLGQWRLTDRRLGLRHMAWSRPLGGQAPVLGIALQNEHDDVAQRRQSPLLALWDGQALTLPAAQGGGEGYAGDIAPTDQGGFLISSQRSGQVFHWNPQVAERLQPVAQLREVGALVAPPAAGVDASVLVAAQATAAQWATSGAGALLAWPAGLVVDNHWIALAPA